MSRFQEKNKKLFELEVKTADEVWDKKTLRKGKPTYRKDIEIFGRIDKGTSAMISSTNQIGENHRFIEDTSNLPKNLKDKIVKVFKNDNRKVVYLIKKKK